MKALENKDIYLKYIDCLNSRRLDDIAEFAHDELTYNRKLITLKDYKDMLAENISDIPDLYFNIDLLVVNEETVACRLKFDCTPVEEFMGIRVNGKKVSFTEHVFYKLKDKKIIEVWSLIDKDAIRSQVSS